MQGAQERPRPGQHLKNTFYFQRDINQFVNVIKGALEPLSVPTTDGIITTLDPIGWKSEYVTNLTLLTFRTSFVRNGQNPNQNKALNLGASAATYTVGGMATHWTCATPRQHSSERSDLLTDEEYDRYYTEGEKLLKTHNDQFEGIRNTSNSKIC